MAIKNILLVDDSKTELHFMSELLAKRGYSVRTAENGEDAMRKLEEGKPDLILMACAKARATTSSSRSTPTSWCPRSAPSTEGLGRFRLNRSRTPDGQQGSTA